MALALRIAISVAMLAFLAFQVQWAQTYDVLLKSHWQWLVLAFVAFNASMVLASGRWLQLLNGATRARSNLGAAVRATYASLWLSNFLPTAFGGDIARVTAARRAGADIPRTLAVCLVDRYLGLVTLSLLFLMSEVLTALVQGPSGFRFVSVQLAALFVGSLVVLFVMTRLRARRRWLRRRWFRMCVRCSSVIRVVAGAGKLRTRLIVLNVLACLFGVGAYWAAAKCLAPDVSFTAAMAAATLGTLASALPISLSGWGVRETTVAAVLAQSAGVPVTEAGLIALLNGLVIGCTALIGLAAWIDHRPRAVERPLLQH